MKHPILTFAILLTLTHCRQEERETPIPAFYHWQTHFQLTSEERAYLDSLQVGRLYVKAFDVDWDGGLEQPVPQATVQGLAEYELEYALVPTVFITNRVFLELDVDGVDRLARRVDGKLQRLLRPISAGLVREIQIDCDWTERTRERYFRFLESLRGGLGASRVTLSATIRLHQVRYFERTGVPPVDRGMLMAYNVGRVRDWVENQSILNPRAVAPYLQHMERYPLPLDLALPAFAWTAVFRDSRLVQLMHALRAEELDAEPAFYRLDENRYELRESMYFKGQYLYRGDRLRAEAPTPAMLRETAAMLKPYMVQGKRHLAFFHLDTTTVKHYPSHALLRVIDELHPR